MIISGKRIRNVDKYLFEFKEGESLYIGLQNASIYKHELREYGLLGKVKEYVFLPRPLKSITDFNTNGRWVPDKSLPLEERTFESQYHVVDWHGNDHYGVRYHTRKCYQRRFISPPSLELTYSNDLLLSPLFVLSEKNKPLIKHAINMFLEMFGRCEVLTEKYTPKKVVRIERLSWTILPKGEFPWEKAKSYLDSIINNIQPKYRIVISKRHESITKNVPDFMAIGDQSFFGYVIYGFQKKGIFIFESNKSNNATYVFKGNWKEASRLTKAEILCGQIHEARIIHNKKWNNNIDKLLCS